MSSNELAVQRFLALSRVRAAATQRHVDAIFKGVESQRRLHGFSTFSRRQLKIVTRSGDLVPFHLNQLQRQIWHAEIRARRRGRKPWFIILKYRKGGVTTLQQALSYWEIWRHKHRPVRTFAQRVEDTRDIFRMVARFYDNQPEQYRHAKTAAEVMMIEFPHRDSYYRAETAGAVSTMRGQTHARIHFSEAAFYPDLRELHKAATEATMTDAAYVLESTPNGKTGRGEAFFAFWKAAKAGKSMFIPLFFPWHSDPANQLPLLFEDELGELTEEEEYRRKRFNLTIEQVKWHRMKQMELVADGRSASAIAQEHPDDDESCFLAGGNPYYDVALMDAYSNYTRPPIRVEENGRLRIFEDPKPDSWYVIGADPAEGVGADDSAAVCLNGETGEQAFSWSWNGIRPDEFGSEVLARLGRLYQSGSGRPAGIGVERQNHGHAVLTGLLRLAEYPIDCVYHHVDPVQHDASGNQLEQKRAPGWNHTQQGKVELTSTIGRILREQYPLFRDEQVLSSIRAVSVGASGGAEFTGRDLAVAAGIAEIIRPHMQPPSGLAWIGGKLVNLDEL